MKIINVLITIDTESVRTSSPSKEQNNPTGIGHNLGFMVATGTKVNSGQGTGDLSFTALVGDTVRVFATSGSDNFDSAVLLYGLPKFGGTQVLSQFSYKSFTKSTVVPNPTSTLPAQIVDEVFWFFEADVIIKGTENYMVQFALYTRDDNGQPVLFGYYAWDPTITVAG